MYQLFLNIGGTDIPVKDFKTESECDEYVKSLDITEYTYLIKFNNILIRTCEVKQGQVIHTRINNHD
jgi:hypothetical protein